jgi:hypothetical protein
VYEPVREVIEHIWKASEQLCGKRLEPALELWLPHYGKHYGSLLPTQQKLLKAVSAATLDRMLAPIKTEVSRRRCGTRPGTLLRTQIPIQGEVWDERRAGFLEADSVAHCGSSLAGDFIWSLTYTCLGSGWTEDRAVWNKGAHGVLEQTKDVEQNLPFPLLGMDFDNGGEWLNWHLVQYLQERVAPVKLTRSRPYHKDDPAGRDARGAKELDVATPGFGLSPAGKARGGAAHQPALQRNVGAVAQLFSALGQTGGEASGRPSLGAAA